MAAVLKTRGRGDRPDDSTTLPKRPAATSDGAPTKRSDTSTTHDGASTAPHPVAATPRHDTTTSRDNTTVPGSATARPVLRIRNLDYAYADAPHPVFENLNIDVAPGEFIAIVGGSGVGKSTLLRSVAGLIPPTAGHIEMNVERSPANRRYAFVFQDARLMPWRRVRANVAYGLTGLKLTQAERDARVDEVLSLTLIDNLAQRWPHQLSGGQVQRAGIARALAVHPKLLLMDEPFSAVDAMTRQKLQDELLSIWGRTHPAVLFVTHDIEEAVYLADRVVVLSDTPARVTVDRCVELPRPRDRNAPELQKIAHEIALKL